MKTREFYFDLPENLIAQQPPKERGTSRLLILERGSGKTEHTTINKFPGLLEPGSLIVLNNSRVRKARLFGTSENGGSVEFLLLNKTEERTWRVLTSKAKKQRPGKTFTFPGNRSGEIIGIEGPMRIIKFDKVRTSGEKIPGRIPTGIRQFLENLPVQPRPLLPVSILPMKSLKKPGRGGWRYDSSLSTLALGHSFL
jgi:S-adenosylmethionine:tRNA ribosyltransferase-isomerase